MTIRVLDNDRPLSITRKGIDCINPSLDVGRQFRGIVALLSFDQHCADALLSYGTYFFHTAQIVHGFFNARAYLLFDFARASARIHHRNGYRVNFDFWEKLLIQGWNRQ